MTFWESVTNILHDWQWRGMLLAPCQSGFSSLSLAAQTVHPRSSRTNAPDSTRRSDSSRPRNVRFCFFGGVCLWAFLVVGFLTPLCCLMLTGVMVGALSTTTLPRMDSKSVVGWLGEFFYLPEVLYIVILIWLLLSGPGWVSLDHLVLS
jgi:hypothetical protein